MSHHNGVSRHPNRPKICQEHLFYRTPLATTRIPFLLFISHRIINDELPLVATAEIWQAKEAVLEDGEWSVIQEIVHSAKADLPFRSPSSQVLSSLAVDFKEWSCFLVHVTASFLLR